MTSLTPVPPEDFRVLIVYPNLTLMLIPNIAVALFNRLFKDRGYMVDFFESTYYESDFESPSLIRMRMLAARSFDIKKELGIVLHTDALGDFRKKVEEFQPHLLVVSCVEDTFQQAVLMLRAVQDLNIPHVLGGVFPTNGAARCFEFSEVRLVGRGEGEQIVVDVAEAVRTGRSLKGIPGTWYRDDDGQVHKTPSPPLVNINKVLPDFSLFESKRFYRPMGGRLFKMMPVETYRGCPYNCTYCNSPAQRTFAKEEGQGNFLRRKSMPVLRDELKWHVDHFQPEFFFFMDDSFLSRPKREIFEFCDMYEEFKIPFWFNTRAESFEANILRRLKEVNCYRIASSIESGNEQYRTKVLKRTISNSELLDRFSILAESGIAFSMDVMIGLPGETRDLVMDSVELIRSIHGFDALTVSIFTPYHGTVLRDVAISNGWVDPKCICTEGYSHSELNMPPPYLSANEIQALQVVFQLYVYFPKSEWPQLRRAEVDDSEGARLREYYSEIYRRDFLGLNQDHNRSFIVEGGGACSTNLKDAFRISPSRLSEGEMSLLTQVT
jgi:anaerobic magnesium-protoporphyrin IX monomethyl ester cyclase